MNNQVSILMSAYNAENSIKASVESILNQTYKNIELLICDDGSTDSTLRIVKQLKNKDRRIRLFVNEKNIGLTKSLNNLISFSKGYFIGRQDSDDQSSSNRIERQLHYLSNKNYDAVVCRASIQSTKKTIPGISFYIPSKLSILFKNPFIHGTLVIKKNVLNDLGNYNEKFYFAQDYKLFSDLLKQNYKIKNLNEVLYSLNVKNNISEIYSTEQKYYANCVKRNINP